MTFKLNASQRDAVEHEQGPLLVLAGAGSGKTRVITARIARLLERGVRPEQVLAVSFTNKAAAEMAERMAGLVGYETAQRLWLSTFHSFGLQFLRQEKRALGYDGKFVVFDQGDCAGLVRELLRQRRGDRKLDVMSLLSRISLWKNEFKTPEELEGSGHEYDAVAAELFPLYEAQLRQMHAVDFDDLVVRPTHILKQDERIREKWQGRFRHILIDEFQDTNGVQLELLMQLRNALNNVCVVGDDDQAIYGWRGADVRNILDFERYFPGAKLVKLEDNYRSRAQILEVANAAMDKGQHQRYDKRLRAARGEGDAVHMVECEDPTEEARLVAAEIRDLHNNSLAYGKMAILYRSNLQARLIEEELRSNGIPYRLFGGSTFFDRKEVKDAAAYMRFAVNPHDQISLRRILNYPPRGVGSSSIEKLERQALLRGIPFAEMVFQADDVEGIPSAAKQSLRALDGVLQRAREAYALGRNMSAATRQLLESVRLPETLRDDAGEAGRRRWGNVEFLLRSIERHEQRPGEERPSLAQFLARITLQNNDNNEQGPGPSQVTLSTLHGAKGLEFHTVFLIGTVEGQLPHSRTTDPKVTEAAPTDVEEERRLFYVGVTRARDRLYISRYKRRMLRGRMVPAAPSRFLDGLPEAATEAYSRAARPSMEMGEVADLAAQFLEQLGSR